MSRTSRFDVRVPHRLYYPVSLVIVLLFCIGCAEVPLTHRKGLHLVPQSQMLAMSFQQYDKVLKESRLCTDQKKVNMVRRVGNRIAGAAGEFLRDSGQKRSPLPPAIIQQITSFMTSTRYITIILEGSYHNNEKSFASFWSFTLF